MRGMPVKESRRRDRRRPENRRDEIMRALSERLPDMDLSKLERPHVELPDIELPRVDIRRVMEDAAVRAGVKERTRSRWPIVAALLIAGIVGLVALLRRPAVRAQVEETARRTRDRLEQMRIDREMTDLSVAAIEDAVGDVAHGADDQHPVAVGPGPEVPVADEIGRPAEADVDGALPVAETSGAR